MLKKIDYFQSFLGFSHFHIFHGSNGAKRALAWSRASPSDPEMICGKSVSSSRAFPCAILSGQKLTLIPGGSPAKTREDVPGKRVDRKSSVCPLRKLGASSSIHAWTTEKQGFRCSLTGVPMVTMMTSQLDTSATEVVKEICLESKHRSSSSGPPSSRNGNLPPWIDSILAASLSTTTTVCPRSASTKDSGKPTCPAPPTTATRRNFSHWALKTVISGFRAKPQQSKRNWWFGNDMFLYSAWGQPMKTASLALSGRLSENMQGPAPDHGSNSNQLLFDELGPNTCSTKFPED